MMHNSSVSFHTNQDHYQKILENRKKQLIYAKNYIHELFDEDKLRFFFIVVSLIGIILWLSGSGNLMMFLTLGFGLICLIVLLRPHHELIESYICPIETKPIGKNNLIPKMKFTPRNW
jgi:hypothetical protein